MFCGVCGGRESAAARKGIGKVRCGTPPSPAATPPLAGEAAGAAATQKGSPARGAGCARRRRLRGALPVGSGNTPQGPAASCPAAHGGSARPRGGRERPPYIAAENGRRPVNGSRLQRPTAGRCKHRPLRRGRVAAGRMRRPGRVLPPCFAGCAAAGQRGKLPNAGTPPAVPGPAARLPCIVGRAFTPAGEVCGGPEGYRQGHVPHPSVG